MRERKRERQREREREGRVRRRGKKKQMIIWRARNRRQNKGIWDRKGIERGKEKKKSNSI